MYGPPTGTVQPTNPVPVSNLATCHLSAGTYLDADYCETILRDVDAVQRRAVAPHMGADTATVLFHARRARILNVVEAAAVLLVTLMGLCLFGANMMVLVYALLIWQWVWLIARAFRAGAAGRQVRRLLWQAVLLGFVAFLVLPLGLVLIVSVLRFMPLGAGAASGLDGLPLMVLLLAAVAFTAGAVRGGFVAGLPTAPVPEPAGASLQRVSKREHARVTVYSGFDPFAHAGECVEFFKFALDLRPPGKDSPRPEEAGDWPAFDADALAAHVAGFLQQLRDDHGRFARIPGLSLDHHFVISGRDTSWPDHPDPPSEVASEVMRFPVAAMRHYLKCQVISWGGEVATTVYVHTALQGRTLYLEFLGYVMPATRDDFHVFDIPWRMGPTGAFVGGLLGAVSLPRLIGRAPRVLWRAMTGALDTATIKDGLGPTDVGAKASVRLLGSEPGFVNYFQWRDPHKYITILERQFFVALTDFLRGKVDLAELETRATTIINNGVVNNGAGSSVNVGVAGSGNSGNSVGAVGTVKGNVGAG